MLDRHSSAVAECVGFRCFETRDDEPEARLTVGSALLICKALMTPSMGATGADEISSRFCSRDYSSVAGTAKASATAR